MTAMLGQARTQLGVIWQWCSADWIQDALELSWGCRAASEANPLL